MKFALLFVFLIFSYVASPSMGQVSLPIDSEGVPIPKEHWKDRDGKTNIHLKDQSTSLMTRAAQPIGLASQLNQLKAEFQKKIEEIKTQTTRSSKDQNEKIAIITVRERKSAQILNQTREEMLALKIQNMDQSNRINQLEQKVAMLQNTQQTSAALTGGNNKYKMKNVASNRNDGQVFKTSTPPSSCQDLAMLDYSLDGLHLVRNKETKKIQTVFCKFSADNKVSQDLIGNVDVKTKSIHFFVQRTNIFSGGQIPFELAVLNEGGAMNLNSGIFTALVAGIYHFEFSGTKLDSGASHLLIYLQVNGVNFGQAYTDVGSTPSLRPRVSYTGSLRLKPNDKVNLYSHPGGILFDGTDHPTQFTGWLVEEDFQM